MSRTEISVNVSIIVVTFSPYFLTLSFDRTIRCDKRKNQNSSTGNVSKTQHEHSDIHIIMVSCHVYCEAARPEMTPSPCFFGNISSRYKQEVQVLKYETGHMYV